MRTLALAAAVLVLSTACSSSSDSPDIRDTTIPGLDCSGENATDPCVTTGSTSAPQAGTTIPGSDVPVPPSDLIPHDEAPTTEPYTGPSNPPITCGPDPDETHPPPCD